MSQPSQLHPDHRSNNHGTLEEAKKWNEQHPDGRLFPDKPKNKPQPKPKARSRKKKR